MPVRIAGVEPGSPAHLAHILPGMTLLRIDGHAIRDVLDYRFYMTASAPTLELCRSDGTPWTVTLRKEQYRDLGLEFDSYLMDKQRRCRNRCVFCFIDQLPRGLRESLYFKDDDDRLSFLFGNYVTLTNLEERDVERILQMHISPVNISVHTTNPRLRESMMGNHRAGQVLEWLPRLAAGGIRLNAQLVLCPGINDGDELERSLTDLTALAPALQSVAVVPVGLTRYRQGLSPLRAFDAHEAAAVIHQVDAWGDRMAQRHGDRICYAADEFYLLAGLPFPDAGHYGAFDQLENGVGLASLLREEFLDGLEAVPGAASRRVLLATGRAAQPLLEELTGAVCSRVSGLAVQVVGIDNHFFGTSITVAGLVTGRDLLRQLEPYMQGSWDALLLPRVMLRREGDLFLDDVSLAEIEAAMQLPVLPVENSGDALLCALLGRE